MKLMVVEDDRYTQRLIGVMCREEGWELIFASNGQEALRCLEVEQGIQLVLSDVMMPEMGGEALLKEIQHRMPDLPVLLMTSHGTIDSAVSFLKAGAVDYITKPLHKEVLLHRIRSVLGVHRLTEENLQLRRELAQRKELQPIIGRSPLLMEILKKLPSIAKTDASVVIYGESGTGKELIAKAIHALSQRREGALVTVNCGALPENLLETELFGHKKGAFTDAIRDHDGLVKEADRGTLFLDEIGEIPLNLQVKLLRFLQQKEYKPLGSTQTERADVRFISATNRDLLFETMQGRFREDLYYRLNIIPIRLPSLRERRDDIPLLVRHFLKRFAEDLQRPYLDIDGQAMKKLQSYDWPGNIRELENKLLQLVVMSEEDRLSAEMIVWPEPRSFSPAGWAARHHERRELHYNDPAAYSSSELPPAPLSVISSPLSPVPLQHPPPSSFSQPSPLSFPPALPASPAPSASRSSTPGIFSSPSLNLFPYPPAQGVEEKVSSSAGVGGAAEEQGEGEADWFSHEHLPPFREAKAEVIHRFEQAYLLGVLRRFRGNIAQAARAAGMDRKNFWEKMQRYHIDAQDFA